MRSLIYFLLCLFVMAALTGCETVKGVGRDIEGTSSYVQHGFSK